MSLLLTAPKKLDTRIGDYAPELRGYEPYEDVTIRCWLANKQACRAAAGRPAGVAKQHSQGESRDRCCLHRLLRLLPCQASSQPLGSCRNIDAPPAAAGAGCRRWSYWCVARALFSLVFRPA